MTKVKTPEEFFKEFTSETVEKTVEQVKEEQVEAVKDEEQELDIEGADVEEGDEEVSEKKEVVENDAVEEETGEEDEVSDGIVFVDEEQEVQEEPDYVKIASELGFEGIKTKDQLIEKYKKDLVKAKEDALEDIPENLKEAVKFAREGGDFMEILEIGSIDYDKVSNLDLIEAKYHKYFLDEKGEFDKDSFTEWVENEGKAKINMLADQIRNEEKSIQQSKLQYVKNKAIEEKNRMNAELKSELERIDSVGGVRLTQSQKDSMYRDTVSGVAMEELFYEGGKISNKKVAQNLFKVRMFDKAIQLAKTSSRNDGKRDVINKATNANVKRRAEKPVAEIKKVDPLDQFFSILKNKK